MGIVYLAKNTINGKCYVGQTKYSLKKRRFEHEKSVRGNKDDSHFHRALRKWGFDAFEWSVLRYGIDPSRLGKLEMFYVAKLKTRSDQNGYNMNDGGEGQPNLTKEYLEKLGKAVSKALRSPEVQAKIRRSFPARNACVKKSWQDPVAREKRVAGITAAANSTEGRKRRSETAKALWQNKEWRDRAVAAMKKTVNDPEFKSKKSEILKKAWIRRKARKKAALERNSDDSS
jgi:group I intron endonuclease